MSPGKDKKDMPLSFVMGNPGEAESKKEETPTPPEPAPIVPDYKRNKLFSLRSSTIKYLEEEALTKRYKFVNDFLEHIISEYRKKEG